MVISYEDLAGLRERYRDKKIALGSGVFDLLHSGHLEYLSGLRKHGDIVVVMVKSDEQVRTHKHHTRPIISESDRVRMVGALKVVDYAFVGPYNVKERDAAPGVHPYEKVFAALQPDIFFSSNPDWKKLETLNTNTQVVIGLRSPDGPSTTSIIAKIKEKA